MADFGSVGSAKVELRASMDRLNGDLERARKASGAAGTKAGKAFSFGFSKGATAVKAALAGILSGAVFKNFLDKTEKAIDKLDEIGKTADSIGLTTDALQELRLAADLSGVSTGELDSAMRRFSRAAAESAQGVESYKESFDRLNISVVDTNGRLKPLDQLLMEVADGFDGMQSSTEKAALAQELFGRSGVRMVNLLNEGSSAIEEMRIQARQLGIVIEESLIRESERLKDELTLVRTEIESNLTRAAIRAGPLLIDLARALGEIAVWAANAWEGLRLLAGFQARDPVIRFGEVASELEGVSADIDAAKRELAELQDLTQRPIDFANAPLKRGESGLEIDIDAALEQRTDRIAEQEDEIAELEARQAQLMAERGELLGQKPEPLDAPEIEPFGGGGGGGGAATAAVDERKKAYESLVQSIRDATIAAQEEREEIGVSIQAIGQEAAVRDQLLTSLENERLTREILQFAQEAGLEETSAEVQELLRLADALNQVSQARDADADALRQHEAAAEKATEREAALASAIESTGDQLIRAAFQGGNFLGILADLILQLIEVELQALLTGQAVGGIGGGGGGSIFGSILGAGLNAIGGAITGGLGSLGGGGNAMFPLNTGQVTGFAEGGFASRGTIAMVGEEGPELGVFGSAARIFSNEDLKNILNAPETRQSYSGPATVQFNITTSDVGGFRRSKPQLAAEMQSILNLGNRQI